MATAKPVNDNQTEELVEYGNSSQTSSNGPAHEFFFVLLQAAVVAHELHLNTRSIAEHLALDEFYKELPGRVDELIESYQGKYGLVMNYPTKANLPQGENPATLLQYLADYIAKHRKAVAPDSYLQNQIDEIEKLLYGTLNKLKFYS